MTHSLAERRNDPSVKEERISYPNWYNGLPINKKYRNVIYIDESPFHLNLIRSHGWARRGETPNPIVNNSRGGNVTMILAVICINIIVSR